MRSREGLKKRIRARNVVRPRIPLDGLDRLAAHLNRFEADPYEDRRPGEAPDARLIRWLSLDSELRPLAETVTELLRQVVGPDFAAHFRRCEMCERWMVARYRNRRRCGPTCHSKVWSRAYRHQTQRLRRGGKRPAARRRPR